MNLGYALTPVDPARAVDEYRLALRLGANDRTINLDELKQDLAGALLSLHRSGEGIAILKELIGTAPASPQLETNLAIAYLESGRLDEARATAERVAARFPWYAPTPPSRSRASPSPRRSWGTALRPAPRGRNT
jgi:tetratricopeptide (TPR) repeat protein